MSDQLVVNSKIKQKVLGYFRSCFGFSEDVSLGLFEKLDQNIRESMPKINKAFEAQNAEEGRSELHALKGVLLNGGLNEEAELALEIEALLKSAPNWVELDAKREAMIKKLMDTNEGTDRKKILIIDDMVFAREFVKKSVTKLFPTILTFEADSGTSALEKLAKEKFDLILCDWELPGAKGPEVLSALRKTENGKDTPFVIITSSSDKEHVLMAKQLGANDYLLKPVKLDILASKIRNLLVSRRQT